MKIGILVVSIGVILSFASLQAYTPMRCGEKEYYDRDKEMCLPMDAKQATAVYLLSIASGNQ